MIDISEITSAIIQAGQTPPASIIADKGSNMTKQFRERFHPKDCPKCGELIIPVTNGESNEMHGFKLHCPECKSFIGWGGKADMVFRKKAIKEQHDNA